MGIKVDLLGEPVVEWLRLYLAALSDDYLDRKQLDVTSNGNTTKLQ
jgi:hypothetical protein